MSRSHAQRLCDDMAADLVSLRRDLHREPEVGLTLPKTQARILQALDGLPLEITLGRGLSSITAVLRGTKQVDGPRRSVLLRGDMDGLPVQEMTDLPYASPHGTMHACGHDLHVALLVGAARALCELRDELGGEVIFMFQPGEEGFDGAGSMIAEGVLDAAGERPIAAYAIHVTSALEPHGTFCTRPGPMMAASDSMDVLIKGRGGHGSAPQKAADPIPAAAEMVLATQVMLGRRFDAFDPVVVSVGRISGGTADNVIPETAEIEATLRTFSAEARERLFELLPPTMEAVAAQHGVTAEVRLVEGYPCTVNDAEATESATEVIEELFGRERHARWEHPLTGSEDFSRVLQEVPGTFIFLSAVPADVDHTTAAYNHSAYAVFDDSVLPDAAALMAELALRAFD